MIPNTNTLLHLCFGSSPAAHECAYCTMRCRQLPEESFLLTCTKKHENKHVFRFHLRLCTMSGSFLWVFPFFISHASLFFHSPRALQASAQNSPTSSVLYYDWLQRSVCVCLSASHGLIVLSMTLICTVCVALSDCSLFPCQAPCSLFQLCLSIYFPFLWKQVFVWHAGCPMCLGSASAVSFLYYGWFCVWRLMPHSGATI